MMRYLVFLFVFLIHSISYAAVPSWKMIPAESSLSFTGTLNGGSTSGQFKNFSAEIFFDRNKLKESHVKIIVDIMSIFTSYAEIANTLKMPDWLDSKSFPKAIFISNQFVKKPDNSYEANGSLKIRDKSIPVTLTFTEKELADKKVQVTGSATFNRLAFGVGKGQYASTSEVADAVKVDFVVTAVEK